MSAFPPTSGPRSLIARLSNFDCKIKGPPANFRLRRADLGGITGGVQHTVEGHSVVALSIHGAAQDNAFLIPAPKANSALSSCTLLQWRGYCKSYSDTTSAHIVQMLHCSASCVILVQLRFCYLLTPNPAPFFWIYLSGEGGNIHVSHASLSSHSSLFQILALAAHFLASRAPLSLAMVR